MARLTRSLKALMVVAVAAAMLAPPPTSAQALYGSIVGTVVDESGLVVPGATVTATNPGTGSTLETVSDETGSYTFHNLLPGVYDLAASLQGFREFRQTGIDISAGNPVRRDIKLEIGALTEVVTVVSETALLKTEKADLSTKLTSKAVVNLPLNQYRNYQALLNLVPGATPAQFQNAEIATPGRALSTSVNGTQRNSNAFSTDGARSVDVWLPHHVGYVQPAETIETVTVSTNNFDADQGMAAGAAVTVITKSGTNHVRGSGFLLRNQDELNANTFNNNAFGLPKPQIENNIFGGTVGGPIIRNKLFYFGGWERYQSRRVIEARSSVPSLKMRNGDFSEVAAAFPSFRLYNPYTGGAGGVAREQFSGFVIPPQLISAVSRRVLGYYPEPNTSLDLNSNGLPDDFLQQRKPKSNRDNFDVKVTWQRAPTHSVWGKLALLDSEVIDNFILGFDNGSTGATRVYVGTIGHTLTLGPNLVVDGNFGINRQDQLITGPDYGQNLGSEVLGIPGTNGNSIRQSGLPSFDSNYALGTTPSWMPTFRRERSYTFSSAVTWLKGRHQIRTGADVIHHQLNHFVAEFGGAGGVRGGLVFGNSVTAAPGYIPLSWNQFAAFLLGLPSRVQKDVQDIEMTGREWQYGFYATDRWYVNNRLTLNLGLRFELYPIMTRRDRGLERLDYATYEVLLGGLGNTPEDVGIDVKKFYIAPRLGASYRLNDVMVVRGGYGRTFNPLPWTRPLRGSFPFDIFFNQTAEQYGWISTLDSGIPPVPVPDLSSGRVRLPPNYFMRSPDPNNVDRATIQQMNVAVERRLPGDISVEGAYVHTRTDGGYADRNLNYSEFGAGQAGRKFFSAAGTTDVLEWAARTKSRYHALQVAINRPFKNGLLLKGAYTLSRAQNETDDDGWTGLNWHHPDVLDRNFALAGYDRTHVLQMGFVYEVPFARQSRSVLGRIVQNWQVNGIYAAYSGTPFSIGGSNPALNCPGCGSVLINVNGDPKPTGTPGSTTERWYDISLFSQPTGVNPAGFGTSRRNQFRRPGVWNMDLGLFRSIPVGRFRPQLRIQASNVFNHTNWGAPSTNFNDPTRFLTFTPGAAHAFDTIAGTATRERTVQIGLRVEF